MAGAVARMAPRVVASNGVMVAGARRSCGHAYLCGVASNGMTVAGACRSGGHAYLCGGGNQQCSVF